MTRKNDESGATLVQDIGSACPGKGVALKTAKDSVAATTLLSFVFFDLSRHAPA